LLLVGCHYAGCSYAECHYAECRGAYYTPALIRTKKVSYDYSLLFVIIPDAVMLIVTMLNVMALTI
jgi:hypothetical protein